MFIADNFIKGQSMKKSFIFINFVILLALFTGLPLYAKSSANKKVVERKLGQLFTQKIKIGGKKVSCKLIFYGITEYDEDGNEVHMSTLNDRETFSEYDSKGKEVYHKTVSSSGTTESWYEYGENGNDVHILIISDLLGQNDIYREYDASGNKIFEQVGGKLYGGTCKYWYDYDTDGKLIHYKTSSDYEKWYEYDEKGREIRTYNSEGKESLCEYDSNGNKIYSKSIDDFEEWWEYDKKGNKTYYRNNSGTEEWYEYDSKGNLTHEKWSFNDFEYWAEYDSKKNEIYRKYASGSQYWYEYEFYPNGKIKVKKEYLII